jgi:predicted lipoprotein with Yx(FWY)xxD motif
MIRTRVLPLVALAAAAAVSLGACGTTSTLAGTPSPAPAAASAPVPVAPLAPAGPALTASPTDALGTVVVDGTGFTLYRFDKDKPKPSKSNCNGACAAQWPPVVVTSAEAVKDVQLDGVDRAAVGTVKRADGALQLTIGGWPVYRFGGDKQAGDTAGQGVGKTWFAVAPSGKKATATN